MECVGYPDSAGFALPVPSLFYRRPQDVSRCLQCIERIDVLSGNGARRVDGGDEGSLSGSRACAGSIEFNVSGTARLTERCFRGEEEADADSCSCGLA